MNQQRKQRESPSFWLRGVVTVLLLAAVAVVLSYAATSRGPTPLTSPINTPTPNTDWYATKQADMRTAEAGRAVQGTPVPTSLYTPSWLGKITPQPTVFLPAPNRTPAGAGALVRVVPPWSPMLYRIENTWYEDTNGATQRTIVWAGAVSEGATGHSTQQGLVIVQILRKSTMNNITGIDVVESTSYLTPCPVGSVRIVDAVGERLRLRSTSGATFYFDVPTRRYVNAPACTPTPTLTPSPTIISPLSTPTDTPTPRTDRTFTGDATTSGLGPSNPISGATVTLYKLTLFDWQMVESVTTDANGQFALHDAGLSESSWYLILIGYPTGYTPTLAQPGIGFLAVGSQILLSLEPLAPGTYSDNHFISLWDPNATPSPGTPTPPPLPTVPWPTPTP